MKSENQQTIPGFGILTCRYCDGRGAFEVFSVPSCRTTLIKCLRCDGTGIIFETKQEKS